ncbi:MAG: DUF1501 domain-containing protein [Deltaproteobacteria bacterium]|nr:DUF1501 domain-containing protein [Deltaproteobacteria bacterium]
MTDTTRRGFVTGCCAAIAAYSGTRFNTVAFGQPGSNEDILVHVFLRGGLDGLNLIPPIDGADRGHYEFARPDLAVPTTGSDAALPLNAQFGLNSRAAPLHDLFTNGSLAVINATGTSTVATRSHFDSMRDIELGTPGTATTSTGWLTRHLQSASNLPPQIVAPALALGGTQQRSLQGSFDSLNMNSSSDFRLNTGPSSWRSAQRVALRRILQRGGSSVHQTGSQTLDALDIVELNVSTTYNPANGAVYPNSTFGNHLKLLAQMIKLNLGLRIATIDFGGWDNHNGQGNAGGGNYGTRVQALAEGLAAFYTDLDGAGDQNFNNRTTLVVQSEFGRRLVENADNGTDHGHGNVMLALGGQVNGGIYGQWPGLANDQLFDGADLAVTTDFRTVLSEILIRRMANRRLGLIFPGWDQYQPLGIVQGTDLPPIFTDPFFQDGFESGDTSAWTATVGGI